MDQIVYRRPAMMRQVKAAKHALVEASAGTGKTWAIEHLVLDLVLEDRCPIDSILVVTFTEKATSELRARIRALLEAALSGSIGDGDAEEYEERCLSAEDLRAVQDALFSFDTAPIFTIHGFCERVLSELAFESGTPFRHRVVDGRRAFHHAFRAELRERLAREAALRALLERYLEREDKSDRDGMIVDLETLLWEAHFHRYLDCPPAQRTAALERARTNPEQKGVLETEIVETFLPSVEGRLTREKRERGEIDYDDMLVWVARALEGDNSASMLAKLRARFRYALIDEFQDTDYLQWRIFRRAFLDSEGQTRLFLVGDPKQAIYSFRGADVYAYLAARNELTQHHGVTPVPLVRNFRSTGDLIDALNLVLDQGASPPLFSGEIQYDNPAVCGRKDLRASSSGTRIKPVTLMRYAGDKVVARRYRPALGRFIASEIRAMLKNPHRAVTITQGNEQRTVTARDIFVLTRTWKESIEIGGYLREAGVPFAFYKLEGLFQTPEALDVLDVMRAVAEPSNRSRVLKAWATPFFAVPLEEMFGLDDIGAESPRLEWLQEWHALAEQERFPELFDRMLHQSGLGNRELFLANSQRELTNYQHVLEILLSDAMAERLSLEELIERLSSYNRELALPPGMNGNVQRIDSDPGAVQVMSVHMSKGLQADVVFLFGGMGRTTIHPKICVYHENGMPLVAIHPALSKEAGDRIKVEERLEDERLTYVAITRARAKLYLPVLPITKHVTGYYKRLLQRLLAMLQNSKGASFDRLFDSAQIHDEEGGEQSSALDPLLGSWTPPAALLGDGESNESRVQQLRWDHRAMVTRSYTSLARKQGEQSVPEPEEFKEGLDGIADAGDLAGGRGVGIFLHEVIERLDFTTLADPIDLAAWRELEPVKELFTITMRRHGVTDAKWFERGSEAIFNTLRSCIALASGVTVGPLFRYNDAPREMEFVYPIPERAHALLGSAGGEDWRAERGYLKGFMDFVFEQDGKTYFADWKSDHLESYDPAAIARHVDANYEMQARIYSVALIRLLGIQNQADYSARFGGLLYVFLRAMRNTTGAAADGIYFRHPSWNEIVAYERELMRVAAPLGAAA